MFKIDKEQTKQARLRMAKKVCEGRHPDIHKAIAEVYANDDSIKSSDNCVMYVPSQSDSHTAINKIALEFAKKNHKKLAELNQQFMDVKSEMSQYENLSQQLGDLSYELQSATRMTWKDLAKKLGLHQYLTGSGVISQGKVAQLMQKQGKEAVMKFLDTYNTKYVPEMNRLAKEINEEAKKGKDLSAMKEATDKYNDCVNRLNAIHSEINWWSGQAPLRKA
jgi:DNA repair exonuclease SbcCD ATPase subunit